MTVEDISSLKMLGNFVGSREPFRMSSGQQLLYEITDSFINFKENRSNSIVSIVAANSLGAWTSGGTVMTMFEPHIYETGR